VATTLTLSHSKNRERQLLLLTKKTTCRPIELPGHRHCVVLAGFKGARKKKAFFDVRSASAVNEWMKIVSFIGGKATQRGYWQSALISAKIEARQRLRARLLGFDDLARRIAKLDASARKRRRHLHFKVRRLLLQLATAYSKNYQALIRWNDVSSFFLHLIG